MTKLRHLLAVLIAVGITTAPAMAQPYRVYPHPRWHHWHHPYFHRFHRPYVYRRAPAVVVEPNLYGPHPY